MGEIEKEEGLGNAKFNADVNEEAKFAKELYKRESEPLKAIYIFTSKEKDLTRHPKFVSCFLSRP